MTAPNPLPSQELLRALLDYEPATGRLTWKLRPADFPHAKQFNSTYAGKPALTAIKAGGYCGGKLLGEYVMAHRVIFKLVHGIEPPEIDHDNGVRHDNREANLFAATKCDNSRNCKRRSTNTSGITGVARNRNGWRAFITIKGKARHLGAFPLTEEGKGQAAALRKAAERENGFSPKHGLTAAERAGASAQA